MAPRSLDRPKPVPGHKLAGTSFGVSVRCECGWRSEVWLGKGARGQALGEWRNHQYKHVAARVAEAVS